jgi:hypothetical protein
MSDDYTPNAFRGLLWAVAFSIPIWAALIWLVRKVMGS